MLLSNFLPLYFQIKCLFVAWLVFDHGAEKLFRYLETSLSSFNSINAYCSMIGELESLPPDLLRLADTHVEGCDYKTYIKSGDPQLTASLSGFSITALVHWVTLYWRIVTKHMARKGADGSSFLTGWTTPAEDMAKLYEWLSSDEFKDLVKRNDEIKTEDYDKWFGNGNLEKQIADFRSFQPRLASRPLLATISLPSLVGHLSWSALDSPPGTLRLSQPCISRSDTLPCT